MFRNNQHKLTERPSARAWDRLERRLDNHQQEQRRGRVVLFRQLSMAAAVVFLIGVVGLLATVGTSMRSANVPIADSQIEYLNVSPSELGVEQIREYQEKLYSVQTISNERVQAKKDLRLASRKMQ